MFFLDSQFTPEYKVISSDYNYGLGLWDSLIVLVTYILPAWFIQKIVIYFSLFLVPLSGYFILKKYISRSSAFVTALFLLWNPFIYSRFIVGHYRYIIAYALLLPFIYLVSREVNKKNLVIFGVLVFFLIFISPHFVWIGFLVILSQSLIKLIRSLYFQKRPRLKDFFYVLLFAMISFGVYMLSVVILEESISGTQYIFKSGSLLSLLMFEGFWADFEQIQLNSKFIPSLALSMIWVSIYFVAFVGVVRYLFQNKKSNAKVFFGIIAISGLIGIVLASATQAWAGTSYEFFMNNIPGWNVMREAQKWLALYVVFISVFFGFALEQANQFLTKHNSKIRYILPVFAISLIFATTPLFPFLANGQVKSGDYPSSWYQLNSEIKQNDKTLILPWRAYSYFYFIEKRIADPSPRFFNSNVMYNGVINEFREYSTCDIELNSNCINYSSDYSQWRDFLVSEKVNYIVVNKTDNFDEAKFVENISGINELQLVFTDEYTWVYRFEKKN